MSIINVMPQTIRDSKKYNSTIIILLPAPICFFIYAYFHSPHWRKHIACALLSFLRRVILKDRILLVFFTHLHKKSARKFWRFLFSLHGSFCEKRLEGIGIICNQFIRNSSASRSCIERFIFCKAFQAHQHHAQLVAFVESGDGVFS